MVMVRAFSIVALRFVAMASLLSSCASSRFEVRSVPEGAELRSVSGEVLGQTPIELSDEQVSKVVENGIASFRLGSPGYESRLVMIDAMGIRNVQVTLPKIESSLFKSDFVQDYTKDLNRVLRDAFGLQKALLSRNAVDSATRVEAFKKDYPQLAFGYLISAQIAVSEGKNAEALSTLQRAKLLDPDDASIDQNLKLVKGVKP